MKPVCLTLLSISTVLVFASTAWGQVIPRVGRTRPAVICEVPPANYQWGERSSPVSAFSNRFVFMDDPLAEINRPTASQTEQSTKITSVSKSIEISSGFPNDSQLNAGLVPVNQIRREGELPVPGGIEKHSARLNAEPVNEITTPEMANNGVGLPSLILGNSPSTISPVEMTERTTLKNQTISSPRSSSENNTQRDTKLFQWSRDTLQIDQCAISNMALQLGRNGTWVLNLRADQNRIPETDSVAAFNPTLHVKRNRFAVQLRCYSAMTTTPPEIGLKTGKPLMATINLEEFWVENGQPRFLHVGQCDRWIHENFDLIDRVEIEFYYYK